MRSYWSALAKLRKAEEEMVISEIATLTQGPPENLSNDETVLLCNLQNQFDNILYTNVKLKVRLCDLGGGGWSKANKILHTSSD